MEVQVEGGDRRAAMQVGPARSPGVPDHGARRNGFPGPFARPAHGLGPVVRPVGGAREPAPGTALLHPVGSTPVTRPMSPPIARAMRSAVDPAGPKNGDRAAPPASPCANGPRGGRGALSLGRGGFGLPNLRRNVCPHFYLTGTRGAMPVQAPHLLKALVRQEQNISRCQLRGGVHLEQGYVNDVCLSARFNQCVFYEDDLGS